MTEKVVQRGVDFAEVDRAIGDLGAQAIGGADHLAGAEAAAGEQAAADLRPVVAAGVVVDLRRAAELAPGDHGDVVGQAALVQVFDQRRQRPDRTAAGACSSASLKLLL